MVGAAAVGQVVLLNGVSSSGKSMLARQLLADFDTPWFHMGVDMFGAMRAEAQTHDLDEASLTEVLRRTRAGFHRAVRGMASAGNNIVMDHVLSEPWRLADLLTVMARRRRRLCGRALWCRGLDGPRNRTRRSRSRHGCHSDRDHPQPRSLRR
ncbi:AAA family ATPase [Mycolicibacterium septicum]|nr:AAA family ATPase [Mycolicibacterium septicum]